MEKISNIPEERSITPEDHGRVDPKDKKGLLKKVKQGILPDYQPSLDPMFWPDEPGIPFRYKTKEVMYQDIQTELSVRPLNAELGDIANVCSELKVQTSVICFPKEKVKEFVPKMTAYIDHGRQFKTPSKLQLEDFTIDLIKEIIDQAFNEHQKKYHPDDLQDPFSIRLSDHSMADSGDANTLERPKNTLKQKLKIDFPPLGKIFILLLRHRHLSSQERGIFMGVDLVPSFQRVCRWVRRPGERPFETPRPIQISSALPYYNLDSSPFNLFRNEE